jgi:hypothetical protein
MSPEEQCARHQILEIWVIPLALLTMRKQDRLRASAAQNAPDANDPAARFHDAHRTLHKMHDCPETTQWLGGGRFQTIAYLYGPL